MAGMKSKGKKALLLAPGLIAWSLPPPFSILFLFICGYGLIHGQMIFKQIIIIVFWCLFPPHFQGRFLSLSLSSRMHSQTHILLVAYQG